MAGRGGSGGLCKRAQRGDGPAGLCKRAQRGGGSGGWLPCRFARHFVTGRGVAVKWGLRRRSSGVVVKRGCAAVDGGTRRFRRVMREDGGAWWPGGWLPCRFARHFVTGRRGGCCEAGLRRAVGLSAACRVERGLRRRSSGVVVRWGCAAGRRVAVRWGCAAVDGGAAALLDCPPFGKPAAGGCREAERAGPAERTPAHSVCRSHCRGNREGDRLSRKAIRPGSPFHGGFVPAFGGRIIPMKRITN